MSRSIKHRFTSFFICIFFLHLPITKILKYNFGHLQYFAIVHMVKHLSPLNRLQEMVARKGWCVISQQCRWGFCAGEGGLKPGPTPKKPFWETKSIGKWCVRGLQGIGHWTQCSARIIIHNKAVHSVTDAAAYSVLYPHTEKACWGARATISTNTIHNARMVWMGRQEKRGLELAKRSQIIKYI